ncbi:MAG TPA: thioredoxin domain-containing protein [Candidatus Binataceae bacterium]|nr:thioredoxin domain-containing protein [Candidatus Binataceae bacterium]
MNKILRLAAACAAVVVLCAIILAPRGPALSAATGVSDDQLIAFLQKHYRLPSTRNITLGPPIKTPFSKVKSRTVTITDDRGGSLKAMIFVEPGVNQVIVGELLDPKSDPWGRVGLESMHLDDRATMGPANAPVTIVEFADFECPHCAHAMGVVETAVESKYNGRIRLVFKNFPLQGHQWARAAAIAGECVRLQNPSAFWDYAREIYRDQASITPDNLSQHIDDFARHNQLDSEALRACEMGEAADQRVAQDILDGQRANVVSTPTLFIDGIPVMGAEPEVLDSIISSELKKKTG